MYKFKKLLIAGILLFLQAIGLEYINDKLLHGFIQKIPFGQYSIVRFIIYLILLFFPNTLLFKNFIKYIICQEEEIIELMDKFLKMSITEPLLSWFYTMQVIIGILIGKERMFLRVTPQQYMKMHTACAILARKYYYSFYKAPDVIWRVLRNYGGLEYCNEIRNINLICGERYVRQKKDNMHAFSDFNNVNNLIKKYVDPNKVENIPDFSSFDVGFKYVSIKIFDNDEKK